MQSDKPHLLIFRDQIAISVKIQMLFKVDLFLMNYVCKNDQTDKIVNSIILYFGFTYVKIFLFSRTKIYGFRQKIYLLWNAYENRYNFSIYHLENLEDNKDFIRAPQDKARRYQRGNQKPQIEGQTIQ